MCDSRFQRVVAVLSDAVVRVQDVDGLERTASLLAYDGDPPEVDDWLVVHSGYALNKADREDAMTAVADLRAARAHLADQGRTDSAANATDYLHLARTPRS
jgi:hydrogenase maturation factor